MEKLSEQLLLKDILRDCKKFISLEVCPNSLDFDLLKKLKPKFCSIPWLPESYNKTGEFDKAPALTLAKKLITDGYIVLLHLTANDLSRKTVLNILEEVRAAGVLNILALKGDLEPDKSKEPEFSCAADLVKFIKDNFKDDFCIAVGGYPDKHPKAVNMEVDLKKLKEKDVFEKANGIPEIRISRRQYAGLSLEAIRAKYRSLVYEIIDHIFMEMEVDSGADLIVTQAVFSYESLRQFHGKCKEFDINVPIIPGIFIIDSYKSLNFMLTTCKLSVPEDIMEFALKNKDDQEVMESYGIQRAEDIIKEILKSDMFKGTHIFTFNRLNIVERLYSRF